MPGVDGDGDTQINSPGESGRCNDAMEVDEWWSERVWRGECVDAAGGGKEEI